MKQLFVVILVLLHIVGANAQNKSEMSEIKEITLDFKQKKYLNPEGINKIKRGDFYKLIIKNINLNLYEVSLDKIDSFSGNPLTMPGITSLGAEGLTTILSSCSSLGSIIAGVAQKIDENAENQKDTIAPGNKYKSILLSKIDENKTREKELLGKIENFNTAIKSTADKLKEKSKAIDDFFFQKNAIILNSQLENPACSTWKASVDNCTTLESDLKIITEFRSDIDNISKALKLQFDMYSDIAVKMKDLIEKNEKLKSADEVVRKNHGELEVAIKGIAKNVDASHADSLMSSLISVYNNLNYEYTSLPLQFTKDKATLTIKITPKKSANYLQSYSTNLEFPLKSKWFYGVSSGFYGSWLHDDAYSVSSFIPSSDTVPWYKVVQESPGNMEVGISAMVHGGYKIWDPYLSIQIGFGPAISISKTVRPRLMFGGGVAFGNKHKILITGGFMTGYVDRLSNAYDLSTLYKTQPEKIVVSTLDWNGFISVAYLFSL